MKTFLPSVKSSAPVAVSNHAGEFVDVWLDQLATRGKEMHPDTRLFAAAQSQAEWLAENDFNEADPHLGAGGITANERCWSFGYQLPSWWPQEGNQVESATHDDNPNIAAVVVGLMTHETHYQHMWGIGFWEPSIYYGVGYAGGFYVVVTAP
jgi:hypothetical protein